MSLFSKTLVDSWFVFSACEQVWAFSHFLIRNGQKAQRNDASFLTVHEVASGPMDWVVPSGLSLRLQERLPWMFLTIV